MFVKNNAPRLIVIREKNGKEHQLIPGSHEAVEIPDAVAKLAFVQNMLTNGDIVEVAKPAGAKKQDEQKSDDQDESEKEALIADLEGLGVKVDKRWSVDRLKDELNKAMG